MEKNPEPVPKDKDKDKDKDSDQMASMFNVLLMQMKAIQKQMAALGNRMGCVEDMVQESFHSDQPMGPQNTD